MKLSEAILLGMKKYPKKAVGKFYRDSDKACALGCADGATWTEDDLSPGTYFPTDRLRRKFPALAKKPKNEPNHKSKTLTLLELIVDLNDNCGWSRSRIAHWIAKSGNDCEMVP